jgi:V/A-type H+/Na+-transporting ATPase subunit E
MQHKLDQLTQKIYQEGIDKAKDEADKIRQEARQEAKEILESARQEADDIRRQAEENASQLRRNTKADLKLAGQQAISSLRQRIKELLVAKVLDAPARELILDKDFLKQLVLEVTRHWDDAESVELQISEKLRQQMDNTFEQSLLSSVEGLEITYNKRLSQGFRIQPKEGSYQLTFTEEDLKEFFKPFLQQKAEQIIFS